MKKGRTPSAPLFVAVVGGSGAGKSWLADRLQQAFGSKVARLSLDDFYLDRSHLSPARRALINYDHPRAIDWHQFKRVLKNLKAGRNAQLPVYDFTTHCRLRQAKTLKPAPLILVDGLWLLNQPRFRRLFDFSVFRNVPASLRLRRRLERDLACRGRSTDSIRKQFRAMVEPMHRRFVQPQARWAHAVVDHTCDDRQIEELVKRIRAAFSQPRA